MMIRFALLVTASFLALGLIPAHAQESTADPLPTPAAAAATADNPNPTPLMADPGSAPQNPQGEPVPAAPTVPAPDSAAAPAPADTPSPITMPTAATSAPGTSAAATSTACPTPTPRQAQMLADPNLSGSLSSLLTKRLASFNQFDLNCDGLISRDEWMKGVDARFDAADTNHDGVLSADEANKIVDDFEEEAEKDPNLIVSKRAHTLQTRLNAIDADHDGQITRAEWDAYYQARFARLDRNSDGNLDITEYQTDDEEARRQRN